MPQRSRPAPPSNPSSAALAEPLPVERTPDTPAERKHAGGPFKLRGSHAEIEPAQLTELIARSRKEHPKLNFGETVATEDSDEHMQFFGFRRDKESGGYDTSTAMVLREGKSDPRDAEEMPIANLFSVTHVETLASGRSAEENANAVNDPSQKKED